jgi:glycosidase
MHQQSFRPAATTPHRIHPLRKGLWLLPLLATGCATSTHVPISATAEARPAVEAPAPAPPAPAPVTASAPARRWSDEVLYFVVLDRFADGDSSNNTNVERGSAGTFHGGDLKGLLAQIDELHALGVTALWITPLVKNIDGFVTGAGFPDWGYHGYWADDFSKLDPRFGTEEDLHALVRACHERGIKVLLDVVYNHAGYGSRYLKLPETRGWLRSSERGDCGEDDVTQCVSGLPDFKTEQPEVARFLLDQQLAWAKRYQLDGFRLDTLKHVGHDFWKEHRRRTREEVSQDFFLLGELWGGEAESLNTWFEADEMDAGFDFSFQGSTVGFVAGRGRTVAYDRYLRSRYKVRKGYHLAHFLSSHDVTGGLHQLEGDVARFRLAAVLQLTTLGIPVLYYGEEVGRPGGEWPANRGDMPWGELKVAPGAGLPRNEELRRTYQRLISLRRAHPALSRGTHQALYTEGDLYVFLRHDPEVNDTVVVAVNRGESEASVSLPWPAAWSSGTQVEDLLGGGSVPAGATLELKVGALSARILGPKS